MTFSQQCNKKRKNDPRTEPKKDPDEADKKPDTTCVGELDMGAETKNSLGGPHVFYTTKYGSEDLLGMNTKVSTVEGTQVGTQQTVQALAD